MSASDDQQGRPESTGRPSGPKRAKRLSDVVSTKDLTYGVLIAFGFLFAYLVYSAAHSRELVDAQVMDCAQLARNIAQGEGFTTGVVRPLSLAKVNNVSHHPDLLHAPLHPLFMSVFFRFGESHFRKVAWASGIPYFLSLILVYLLALRLFNRRVALLALALYGVNHLVLRYAVSGMEITLATLAVTGVLLLVHMYLSAEEPSPLLAGLCGALVGVCVLVEYVYGVLLIPVLLAMLLGRKGAQKRWSEMALAAAVFAVVLMPWGVRNARITGNPFYTLRTANIANWTKTYKGESLYRQYTEDPPSGLTHLATHPKEAIGKLRPLALSAYADSILNLGGPFIAAFFIAAILMPLPGKGLRELRLVHYGAIALAAGAMCLLADRSRIFVPLSPLAIIVGAACFLRIVDPWVESIHGPKQKRRANILAIGALVAACWFPAVATTVTLEKRGTELTDDLRKVAEDVADETKLPLYTDQPWVLAWYADLNAIYIPQTEQDLHALEATMGPIQGMLLSPAIGSASGDEGTGVWAKLYQAAPQGVQHEGFMLTSQSDMLGENRDWELLRRLPEGMVADDGGSGSQEPGAGSPEDGQD